MAHPEVTALITNYNYGRFIADSLESVLGQTRVPDQIIVVDDGSTDQSRRVLRDYEDRVEVLLKENGGQASAFNYGLERCEGEVVCLLDADDVWLPNKVAAVLASSVSEPGPSVVCHRVQPVNGERVAIGRPLPRRLIRGSIRSRVSRSGGWWPFPPSSALSFRRDFLQRVLPIPEQSFRICADAYLADLAAFAGEVSSLGQVLSEYRLHATNAWHNARRLSREREEMLGHLKHYETRVSTLQVKLPDLGIAESVSLVDHWPHQRLARELGLTRRSLISLTACGLRFPGEPNVLARAKGVGSLWTKTLREGARNRRK